MFASRRLKCLLTALFFASACSDPVIEPPEPPVIESCKNIIRYGHSGKVDITATHGYDDEGQLTTYVETNVAGDEIFRLSRTYDDRRRRIGQIIDTTRFEPGHREMTWEYDDSDRVIRTTYDGWGSDNSFIDTRVTYDEQGRRSSLETEKDGVLSDRVKSVYIEGEPLVVEQQRFNGTDQTLTSGNRYFLGQGRWLERLEVFNVEMVQSAEWYTYEDLSNGRVSQRHFDTGADNVVDGIDTVFWNPSGAVETTEFDSNVDGQIDQRNHYEYDMEGRFERRTWSIFDQGNLEFVTTVVWSENAMALVERLDKPTGQVIEAWSFEYGCNNQWPMNVSIAPVQGFRYDMQTLPFNVDSSTWWQSFDSL